MNYPKFLPYDGSEENQGCCGISDHMRSFVQRCSQQGCKLVQRRGLESNANEVQQLRAGEVTQPQRAPAEPPSWVESPSNFISSCTFFFNALKSHLTLPSRGAAFIVQMVPVTKGSQVWMGSTSEGCRGGYDTRFCPKREYQCFFG